MDALANVDSTPSGESGCYQESHFGASGWHEEDARLLMEQYHHLLQRVEELESSSPDPARGAGAGLSPRKAKPVIDAAKAITSLSPLTDDKSAFR